MRSQALLLAGALLLPALVWGANDAPQAAATVKAATRVAPVGAPQLVDRIEVQVGNEIITGMELDQTLAQVKSRLALELHGAELEKKLREAKQQILDRLIEGKLLLLEARNLKLEVQDAMVDSNTQKEIDALRAQFTEAGSFEQELEREHLTVEELTAQRKIIVRENLMRQRLLQSKLAEFKEGLQLSQEQLRAYYDTHLSEFQNASRVRVRQIFVAHPDPGLASQSFDRQEAEARGRIDQALGLLRSGRSFTEVAKAWSEHKASAAQGGEIGWISQGDTGLPELEKAIFGPLKINQISGVIDTARGFFVVQVLERQAGGAVGFEEVQDSIRQKLTAQTTEKRYQEWVQTLRQKYSVVFAADRT